MVSELIEKSILDVFHYFSIFNYPPTLEEIHTFLKKKTSKRHLVSILEKMEKKSLVKSYKLDGRGWKMEDGGLRMDDGRLKKKQEFFLPSTFYPLSSSDKLPRYTLGEYKSTNNYKFLITNYEKRLKTSLNKIKRVRLYLKLLSYFPQIKLIGLSGSVAMLNADENHDVDLFIITAKNRLWTGRFVALVLAQLLGLRRKRDEARPIFSLPVIKIAAGVSLNHKNKVCLNLFFDESAVGVPKFKQSEYVAHEVLQMKPFVEKNGVYMSFIDANRWVFDIFPNARKVFSIKYKVSSIKNKNSPFSILNTKYLILNTIADKTEQLLKSFQLFFINRHRTNEIVTESQLWFHPEDFEKKIKDCI